MIGSIINLIPGSIVNTLCSFLVSIYKRPNKFWKPLLKDKDISIVLTEYPIITDPSLLSKMAELIKNSKIAKKVSDGYLVSKGNAKALSYVMKYLSKYVAKTKEILVEGNNYIHHKEDLVILGSPVNNDYAHRRYSHLMETYDMPFEINGSEERGDIEFVYRKNRTVFKPRIDSNGNGDDYAIIVNTEYENGKNVVILAGAYMYGTEAASKAVTNEKFLKKIINTKNKIDINNCIFLIKTEVMNHSPREPILVEFNDNNYYIFPLKKRDLDEDENTINNRYQTANN